MKQSVTPTAIKSSKEIFQQFRKAAIEKEEREKALKNKQVEGNKEREAPEKSWYSANPLYLLDFIFQAKIAALRIGLKHAKTALFSISSSKS